MTKSAGFTLTELMITLTILGVLTTAAMPSFKLMMQNYQTRVAAESVANGLQRARAEAVSKNTNVYFALGTGTSWTVDYVNKPVPTDPPLDQRQSNEGSARASIAAVASDLTTTATTITYNNLGQVVANTPNTLPTLSQVTVTVSGGTQSLLIKINAGGSARVCDPTLPATNVRSCSHA